MSRLTERDETRRVSGTDTGTAVTDGLVRDGELTEVVTDHFSLNFDVLELLTVVDTNDAANHLRDDNHITEVSVDGLGLLTQIRVDGTLGLAELLDQVDLLALQTASEAAADTAREELNELLVAHNQQLVKINTTVGKLTEDTLLTLTLSLGGLYTTKKENGERFWVSNHDSGTRK